MVAKRPGRLRANTSKTAIYQALRLSGARNGSSTAYTVFSDSTAAISGAQTDRAGPGQAFARSIIEIGERLAAHGCSVTLRWTPAHRGVEGSEVADGYAKVAAENTGDATDRRCQLAHLTRRTTETRTQATNWIASHAKSSSRYKPTRSSTLSPALRKERSSPGVATSSFQDTP